MTNKKKEFTDIEHKRESHLENILISRGVDYVNLLRASESYPLSETLVKVDSEIPGVVKRALTTKKQYEVAQSILNNPLKGKYVLAISSFPSDLRAKQLAIMIMRNTIQNMIKKKIKGDYPIWHKVYGNYKDSLRDTENEFTANMLILSNISAQSSSLKHEKVRDLLERYCNVPRIVVLGGANPIEFFATKLHYPLTAGLFLGPENRIREV